MAGTVSGREYTNTRVRGFAPWSPKEATVVLLDQVQEILRVYRAYLPMTNRQIFYRMVGANHYPKTEQAYASLCGMLNRARRAQIINFEDIRDDGTSSSPAGGWLSEASFRRSVRHWAQDFSLSDALRQPRHVELWVEASGMVPQAATVAHEYGVDVYSAGGFNGLTDKYETASRLASKNVPSVILHVGDYDPSGLAIIDSLAGDVLEFHHALASRAWHRAAMDGTEPPVEFRRIVVTPEQIELYSLETSPQKATDQRGDHMEETVQAEALSPSELADVIRAEIEATVDMGVMEEVRAESALAQARIMEWVDSADED